MQPLSTVQATCASTAAGRWRAAARSARRANAVIIVLYALRLCGSAMVAV